MRRLIAFVLGPAVLATAVLLAPGAPTNADKGGKNTISATVTMTQSDGGGSGGAPPPPPPCEWVAYRATTDVANLYNGATAAAVAIVNILDFVGPDQQVTVEYYSEGGVLHRFNKVNGRFEYRVTRVCADVNDPTHGTIEWWEAGPPDPAMLLTRTRIASTAIAPPTPVLSPPDEAAINLGLWIAVEPDGPYVARAAFNAAVWAETRAEQASISFDPDNGDDPVDCTGIGTPLTGEGDTIEPGPCGYVYRRHSDVGTHMVTLTTTWRVTWTLSDGRTGRYPDIVIRTTFPYEVFEVQTVGVAG